MNKYYGKIGFYITTETETDVWSSNIIEKNYMGDVNTYSRRYSGNENINDDISVNVEISILADPFAYENYMDIKWVEWMGQKFKVSSITPLYPRINISLGGKYNGN